MYLVYRVQWVVGSAYRASSMVISVLHEATVDISSTVTCSGCTGSGHHWSWYTDHCTIASRISIGNNVVSIL